MRLVIEETVGTATVVEKTKTDIEITPFDAGLAQMLEADQSRTLTATGTVTLTDTDKVIQLIDPDGSNRDVVLPAEASGNHGVLIINTAGAAENLVVKDDGGSTIATVYWGGAGWFISNGVAWKSVGLGTFNPTDYAPAHIAEGRISCHATKAVPTADVTDALKVYLHRYKGKWIALYDVGLSDWERQAIPATAPEIATASLTASKPHDIFVFMSSGTMTLEAVEWTNGSTRATALAKQDGIWVKDGSPNKLYLGSVRTDAAQKTQDSEKQRLVWNFYNRTTKGLLCRDSTNSWVYTLDAWRAANNSTVLGVGRVECMIGIAEDLASFMVKCSLTNAQVNSYAGGIGIDSTSVNSAQIYGHFSATWDTGESFYKGILTAGYHYIQRLERSFAGGTSTWYGDHAGGERFFSGMTGEIKC